MEDLAPDGNPDHAHARPLPAANYKYMTDLLKPADEIFNIDHTHVHRRRRALRRQAGQDGRDMGVGHLPWSQFMDFDPRAKFIDVAQG